MKMKMYKTIEELVAALRSIDNDAADYIWENYTNDDYWKILKNWNGSNLGPLDFFSWVDGPFFPWDALNDQLLKNIDINLDDYQTEATDYTDCHPVVAAAISKGLGIHCLVSNTGECDSWEGDIISGYDDGDRLYIGYCDWKYVEPIKKKEIIARVKGAVEVMQWLVDNDYKPQIEGRWFKRLSFFNQEYWSLCEKKAPEGFIESFPELVEEIET